MINQFPFPLSLAIWGHILGGTLALICFTIPLFSRKGGKLHSRSGWFYAGAMILVVMSTFIITPWRYFFDSSVTDNSRSFAFFLFFIALFSLACLQQGIIVFRFKNRLSKVSSIGSIGLPLILSVFSILMLAMGLTSRNWLFVIFSLLAGRTAIKQIKYWLNPPAHSKDWWFFHLENMFICCIATVTAFTVTAVPRLFPSMNLESIWIWLPPTIVMVPWMIWFTRKYEIQFRLRK
jgi:hypothetical protein